MANYWQDRMAKAQDALTKKNEKQIEKQLAKYYMSAAKQIIADFEAVYNQVLTQAAEGKQVSPALLYRLDKYWQMQGALRQELRKLGEKEISLLTKYFEINFFDIYYSINIEGKKAFNTISSEGARTLINTAWLNDGKSFSQRVWENTEKSIETLNEQLIHTVITGKKTTDLKNSLQERFGVSYSRADTLVRTELCHIQTVAAKQRYEDYGLKYYEILGNDDDSCGNHSVDCHDMNGKRFLYSEMKAGVNAPPFHPNCKCAIIPVID